MKIIHVNNYLRIIQRNETEYKIKTPIGVFQDINDAIEVYPEITENNRIRQCPICQKYFIKYGKTQNNKKYCSKECSRRGKINNTQENYYNKTFVNPNPFQTDYYAQQIKDNENRQTDKQNPLEYHQDDTYWGIGTGNLNTKPSNDPEREHKYIRKELKRLGIV